MHVFNKQRKFFAGVAYLLGIVLLLAALWPGISPSPANTASAQSSMQLRLNSIVCVGQTLTATFEVTNLSSNLQVTSYGTVSYTANGQARTAIFAGRNGSLAIYTDSATLPQPIPSGTINVTSGTVTLTFNSTTLTLNLANPGPVGVTCTAAATATPTTAATSTPTATAVAAATNTPTATAVAPAATDTPTATDTPAATAAAPTATNTAVVSVATDTPVASGAASNIGGAGTPPPSTLPVTGDNTSNPAMPLLLVLGLAFIGVGIVITRSRVTTRS